MSRKANIQPETLGQRIRGLRLAKNLSQGELAEHIGLSRSAIAQWETDRTGLHREHLERLAKIFDTTLGFLVSGETSSLKGDELALLRLYRSRAAEDQRALLELAKRLARN